MTLRYMMSATQLAIATEQEKQAEAARSRDEIAKKIRNTDFSYNVFWGFGFPSLMDMLRRKKAS